MSSSGQAASASACASVSPGEVMARLAPALSRMKAASRPCSLALIGTATPPAYQMP